MVRKTTLAEDHRCFMLLVIVCYEGVLQFSCDSQLEVRLGQIECETIDRNMMTQDRCS